MKIDEDEAYENLLEQIGEDRYKEVVTIGRGGLSIAQKLAYHLNVPVRVCRERADMGQISMDSLFVDDIEDTSDTLLSVSVRCNTAVLVQKETSLGLATYVGVKVNTPKYIHFSWEGK